MSEPTGRQSFSERMGFIEPKEAIQIHGMDDELRADLYNFLCELFRSLWDDIFQQVMSYGCNNFGRELAYDFWTKFLHELADEVPNRSIDIFLYEFKKVFFDFEWYEVYDSIEYVLLWLKDKADDVTFEGVRENLNGVLAGGRSGYRFIEDCLVPISDVVELGSLAKTLELPDRFSNSRTHIGEALKLLSDRTTKDFRNAVKEAICGVESAAQVVSGCKPATLGDALKAVEKRYSLHSALKEAWSKLYGFTSDASGIRHALTNGADPVSLALARYMLVCCSAFINYLVSFEVDGER